MSDPHDEPNRFEILKMDYEMARDDERTFSNIQAAVASIAVALLAVMATMVSDTCQLSDAKDCKEVPDLFLAAAPSVPLAALAFLQLLGTVSSVRSYYLRALERELRSHVRSPLAELRGFAPIRPASYVELITEVTTMRRGRAGYRVLSFLILCITFSVFAGFTVYLAVRLGGGYTAAMLVFYGASFLFLAADVAGSTLGARTVFVRVAQQFYVRAGRPLLSATATAPHTGRGIVSYLVMPRPEDWSKLLFVPAVFLAASASRGEPFDWPALLVSLLVAEYFVYAARYQWNDIRGVAADAAHPEAGVRLRLPHSADRKRLRSIVGWSLAVALVRVLAAVLVGWATGELPLTLAFLGAVFAVAALYELLRTRAQAPAVTERGRARLARGLWLTVGTGYVLRFLVGVHAAGVPIDAPLALVGGAFSYVFGIMFVLLTWVLEATGHCRASATGVWYQARELRGRPHQSRLLRHLRGLSVSEHPDPHPSAPSVLNCGATKVLRHRSALFAPWNVALWASAVAGAPLAVVLAGVPLDSATLWWTGGASAAGALALSLVGGTPGRAAVLLLATGGIVLAAVRSAAGTAITWDDAFLVVPWIVTAGTYVMFSDQSYRDLKHFAADLLDGARRLALRLLRSVTGPDTWQAIR
ncbi:hypothetical protein ACIQPQ_03045 [Streptomyces sp. NPDC091281]|uniref:hypothetical protein n=1 Tax=Streptomyces sp. NPDC091281 TaxID=3365985 RepID=UPI00381DB743